MPVMVISFAGCASGRASSLSATEVRLEGQLGEGLRGGITKGRLVAGDGETTERPVDLCIQGDGCREHTACAEGPGRSPEVMPSRSPSIGPGAATAQMVAVMGVGTTVIWVIGIERLRKHGDVDGRDVYVLSIGWQVQVERRVLVGRRGALPGGRLITVAIPQTEPLRVASAIGP